MMLGRLAWLVVAFQLLLAGVMSLLIADWPWQHRLLVAAWGFACWVLALIYGLRVREAALLDKGGPR